MRAHALPRDLGVLADKKAGLSGLFFCSPELCVSGSVTPAVFSQEDMMPHYALFFLVVALLAGALGLGGVVGASAGIAQIVFFLFLAFLVIPPVMGLVRRT